MQTGWYDQTKRRVRDLSSAGFRIILELAVRRVACRTCGDVKRERLGIGRQRDDGIIATQRRTEAALRLVENGA